MLKGKAKSKGLPLELCLNYLSHAGVGAIAWWLNDDKAHSPEQVAAWLHQLNQQTVEHVLGSRKFS